MIKDESNEKNSVETGNSLYAIVLLLFFIDWYTCVEIKSQVLKSVVYWGLLAGTPVILILNILLLSKGVQKIIAISIPILLSVFIVINNPFDILLRIESWKTQTIIYKNRKSENRKIEHQMQGIGAFGYRKRNIEVSYIIPFFIIINIPEPHPEKNPDWVKVNLEVNELDLKYP